MVRGDPIARRPCLISTNTKKLISKEITFVDDTLLLYLYSGHSMPGAGLISYLYDHFSSQTYKVATIIVPTEVQ